MTRLEMLVYEYDWLDAGKHEGGTTDPVLFTRAYRMPGPHSAGVGVDEAMWHLGHSQRCRAMLFHPAPPWKPVLIIGVHRLWAALAPSDWRPRAMVLVKMAVACRFWRCCHQLSSTRGATDMPFGERQPQNGNTCPACRPDRRAESMLLSGMLTEQSRKSVKSAAASRSVGVAFHGVLTKPALCGRQPHQN